MYFGKVEGGSGIQALLPEAIDPASAFMKIASEALK
jgi:hypothetical protein